MRQDKIVLVTGASGGIGYETAKLFVQNGAKVYGTSRKGGEQRDGITMLKMDVTDDESVSSALGELLAREGRLDVLVNNAGSGIAGPVTDTLPEELTRQMDVNFIGVLRVVRACTDALIASKGVIINLSSVAGVLPIPFQSAYSASKYALEALSECMRLEMKPLGVRVATVLPGDTKTGFTASRQLNAVISEKYEKRFRDSVQRMEHDEQNGMPPSAVAKVIYKTAMKRNPPVRVTCGISYKLVRFLKRILPDRLLSYLLGKLYA